MRDRWMKYIVVDKWDPFIFPNNVTHSNFAFRMNIDEKNITSAGFIRFINGIECDGESLSLKIRSHPIEDTKLFEKLMMDD